MNAPIKKSQGMTGYAIIKQTITLPPKLSALPEFNNISALMVEIEVNSINSRFLEINCRLDSAVKSLESLIRKTYKNYFERGRISLSVAVDVVATENKEDNLDEENKNFSANLEQLISWQQLVVGKVQGAKTLSVYEITKLLNVDFNINNSENQNKDFSQLWKNESWQEFASEIFSEVINTSAQELTKAREDEAKSTITNMFEKTTLMQKLLPEIINKSAHEKAQSFNKLNAQIKELSVELDPQRLSQEVALLVTRVDITEECERLQGHLISLEKLLTSQPNQLGKPLEFLLQELGREVNTIASKTSDNEITNIALTLKMTLEKIREQAQNLQ